MGISLALVYPMQGLFSGNQNIYFLWGMADLLPSVFAADPLLNSPDPYPLFSWLISIFPPQFLQIWTTLIYILLNSVYSYSLFGIANRITELYKNEKQLLSFVTLFLFLHSSPIWGTYFQTLLNVDLRWMWDSGIAEQGVLRGYLQPSAFGVFFLLSMHQGMKKNYSAAILSLLPAVIIHANYLFLGGLITVLLLFLSRFEKKSLVSAGFLLLCVAPYSIYILNHFVFLDSEVSSAINAAVNLGFEENIHLNPNNWMNPKFYLQLITMFFGMIFLWKTSLRNIILGITVLGIGLTLTAYLTNNITLISLNPWRFSIILMPISTTIILSKLIGSSSWVSVRLFVLSAISTISFALIYYRIFGNGTSEFLTNWRIIQLFGFILILSTIWFISKKSILKFLEPMVILGLILVGISSLYIDNISRKNSTQFQVISIISKKTEPNTIYIIPPSWTSFRMNAQKAVLQIKILFTGPHFLN
ncbi:MAG: hypothetical protein JKX84_08980 [Flavobacteriales bacterium]|nr:hypothetical protein [Flavobacteriales bacterium]